MRDDSAVVTGGVRLHLRCWDSAGNDLRRPFLLVHGLASNARLWDGVAEHAGRRGSPGGRRRPARPRPVGQARRRLRPRHLRRRPRAGDRPPRPGAARGRRPVVGRQRRAAAGRTTGPTWCTRWPSSTAAGSASRDTFPNWEDCARQLRPARSRRHAVHAHRRPRCASPTRVGRRTASTATLANFEVLEDGTVRPWLSLDHHLAVLRDLWAARPARRSTPAWPGPCCSSRPTTARTGTGMVAKRRAVAEALELLPDARVQWFGPPADHDLHAAAARPRWPALLLGLAA